MLSKDRVMSDHSNANVELRFAFDLTDKHYKSDILGSALFVIVISVLLGALINWASIAEIDQISRAQGQIIASERTQIIQSARNGVVAELLVKEGQLIKKDQLLFVLDKSQEEAAYKDSRAKVAALEAALIRLKAEMFNQPLIFPAEIRAYPEFIKNQKELYERRQRALFAEVNTYIEGLKLVQEELELVNELAKTGDIGKSEVLRLKKQQSELQGQINNARNKYFKDAQTEMTKAQEDLSEQKNMLIEKTTNFDRTEVLSPVDGQVKSITVTTKGASVQAGDAILEILPNGDLVLEVKLKPVDISYIIIGLPVSVKLDAFDYTIFGSLKGEVSYVSPDALMEKTPQGEQPYYRVQVRIDDQYIAQQNTLHKRPIIIQPGMTATAEIITGHQTILAYLTKPVIKTLSESMGER